MLTDMELVTNFAYICIKVLVGNITKRFSVDKTMSTEEHPLKSVFVEQIIYTEEHPLPYVSSHFPLLDPTNSP